METPTTALVEVAPELPAIPTRQGINISGDTMTLATADYPEDHRALIRWIYSFAQDNKMGWEEIAREASISTTTLYRIWTDTYRYPEFETIDGKRLPHPRSRQRIALGSICEKITHFKELVEERAIANRLPFIETSVWRRVDKLCRESLIMQTISHIYGESQIGKTAALKEFVRRNNHGQTVYVLCPAAGGVQSLMKAIAEACHVSPKSSFDNLRSRVENYFDGTKLLIIDEVHEIFGTYQKTSIRRCMSVLRQMQEKSQCGMVLCGTNDFRNELERGEYAQALKQVRKRGIWELQLESVPAPDDLALIARHYNLGIPDATAKDLIHWIAQNFGLGKYTKFMARASQMAAKRHQPFTWSHFVNTVGIASKLKEAPGSKP